MFGIPETGTTSNVASLVLRDSQADEIELLALVRRYVTQHREAFTYAQFRREFIERFAVLSHGDIRIEHWCNQIESGCAAYDNDIIDASGLHCYFNGLLARPLH